MMTTIFGRFLEFSIPTRDIQASLEFYRTLGFSELSVGDIRHYHYGVVTDGRIAVGLHAGGIEEPALSFVKTDVAAYLQRVVPANEKLFFSRLGDEMFHEIGVHTPAGHLLIMMEARTFSRTRLTDLPAPITGFFLEISLGCRDIDDSTRYWTDAGFMANHDTVADMDIDCAELLAPGLRLGLRTDLPTGQATLRFAPDDPGRTVEALERHNIPVQKRSDCHRVTTPEGIYLDLADS